MVPINPRFASMLFALLSAVIVDGCDHENPPPDAAAPALTASAAATPERGHIRAPDVPKVPFGNQPCQALTASELKDLQMAGAHGKPDRAPATLPLDNLCFFGAVHYGFMTQTDYHFNQDGNRSTSRRAPVDLPGAFYDQQGGLWISKNGYYVAITAGHDIDHKIASLIAAKL